MHIQHRKNTKAPGAPEKTSDKIGRIALAVVVTLLFLETALKIDVVAPAVVSIIMTPSALVLNAGH